MSNAMLMIVISECTPAVEKCDGDLKEKIRASMNAAKDHFMVRDRDIQFRGAIGAVMQHYGKESDEYKRMASEIDGLRKLSAMLSAMQAGLSVSIPDVEDDAPEPIGMMKMWHEIIKM